MSLLHPTLPSHERRHSCGGIPEVRGGSSVEALVIKTKSSRHVLERFAPHFILSLLHQDPWLPRGRLWGWRSGQFPEEDVRDDPPVRRNHPAAVALRLQAGGTSRFVNMQSFKSTLSSLRPLLWQVETWTPVALCVCFSVLLTAWTTAGAGWLRCSTWSLWPTSRQRCCLTFWRWDVGSYLTSALQTQTHGHQLDQRD